MSKKMLIDASHPEETRVAIVDGTHVSDLDFESRDKRQLRGNVYLARVTRVEPSLQAAFIEYGGNRHGFLAFPEIHPDYYNIPAADKAALAEEEARIAAEANEDAEDEDEDDTDENLDPDSDDAADEADAEVAEEQVKVAKARRRSGRKRYKIQEVIKRGQILLVQAVKEERGNKGAAMTTYLSLAGRYCVLMPNTPRGGGISRKISNGNDRKRLKKVMSDLDVPQGMGVIVRTAGAKRNKTEIKRDYDYLSKLWNEIRETTLKSIAPALIHEEGNLVKRSIRDLYNKEIGEVLVAGDRAHATAKAFMKMLMPSHAKNVKSYTDPVPLFLRYGVERQIEASLDATVQLKSGGYLVIHPTEALVSVDVNSGRSTKERNVERTALKTNLEAADEVARQMRMRDLAGLIVIDFIDMDENKNNRAVEKRMKEALSVDRARVQTGRISQFGLMEISRQRRRRSLLDASTTVCPHCNGVGRKRTVESSALKAIRAVEEIAVRGQVKRIRLKTSNDVSVYIFNEKRDLLVKVEEDFDVFTELVGDDEMIRPDFDIEVVEKSRKRKDGLVEIEKAVRKEYEDAKKAAAAEAKAKKKAADEDADASEDEDEEEAREDKPSSGRSRRRRGRRGGRGRKRSETQDSEIQDPETQNEVTQDEDAGGEDAGDEKDVAAPRPRRRRRSAQSGDTAEVTDTGEETDPPKRRRRRAPAKSEDGASVEEAPKRTRRKAPAKAAEAKPEGEEDAQDKPKRTRRKAPAKTSADGTDGASKPARRKAAAKASEKPEDATGKDTPRRTRRKAPAKSESDSVADTVAVENDPAVEAKPVRKRATRKAPKKSAPEKAEAKAKAPARKRAAPKAKPTDTGAESTTKPRRRRAPAKAKADGEMAASAATSAAKTTAPKKTASKAAPAKRAPRKTAAQKAAEGNPIEMPPDQVSVAKDGASEPAASDAAKPGKKKRGWWNRRK